MAKTENSVWDSMTFDQQYNLIKRKCEYLKTDEDGNEYYFLKDKYFVSANPKSSEILAVGKVENPEAYKEIYAMLYRGVAFKRAFLKDLKRQILLQKVAELPIQLTANQLQEYRKHTADD